MKFFRIILAAALCACAAVAAAAQAPLLEKTVVVDLPAQPLPGALISLSRQAGIQIVMPANLLDELRSPALHGPMTLDQAFRRALAGTRLRFHQVGEDIVGIEAQAEGREPQPAK